MKMKFLHIVPFSTKELQDLVALSVACVRVERRVRHLAMSPNCLGDVKSAINGLLNSFQNKFDVSFNGFILGYKNVKIITDRATIINDASFMHLDIEADFYIFTPEVGCTLFGVVNKKGVDHIGCLVHKCFHVAIPWSAEERGGEWLGASVNIGDQVTFRVEICDFTGSLPYIRGKLINLRSSCVTSVKEDEADGISKRTRKKKKDRHKEGDQSLGSADCDVMATVVKQKIQPESETKHKKRKRSLEDERGTGAERKKKKREMEGYEAVCCETAENEGLHMTHVAPEDAEYGTILESLKETYLKEAQENLNPKAHKRKKKHKLSSDTNEGKETIAEVTEDLQHANEEMYYHDHALEVKTMHKNKRKQQENFDVDSPHPVTYTGVRKAVGKLVDTLHVSSIVPALTTSSAAFPGTSLQESDLVVKGQSSKAKKKNKEYDSHNMKVLHIQSRAEIFRSQKSPVMNNLESDNCLVVKDLSPESKEKIKECDSHNLKALDVQSKAEIFASQKLPVMDNVESNTCFKGEYHKTKKEKRKKRDLHDEKLSYVQNKNGKSTAKEESSVAFEGNQSSVSNTGNVEEVQVIAVPSVADLLNHAKNQLKVKLPKKHKKKEGKKQHKSKESKDKTSVSFDATAMLAQYMSKFEATGKGDTADERHSSKGDAANVTTSNPSFRSSFCLTGAGMANAADRKRKKMNKGKGDAVPVQRSSLLLPSSHSCNEADKSVGQDSVSNNSVESLIEPLKLSASECDVLRTPEKCFIDKVSTSTKSSVSSTVETSLASPVKGCGSKLSILSPKQVTSLETTPSRNILSQKGTSDSHLPPVVSPSSKKNLKEASDVKSPGTKLRTPVSSGFTHHLNLNKLTTHDKSLGSCSGREFINANWMLPHASVVLQRLKSPSVDSRASAGMPEISPLQAKSVNEVSIDVVTETGIPEIKDNHKAKRKHKGKKSKIKDDKDTGHVKKKKKAQDNTRINENELELVDRREEHKEENTGTEGKQDKSKEKDSKGNLVDLKMLASKLFTTYLQQEK